MDIPQWFFSFFLSEYSAMVILFSKWTFHNGYTLFTMVVLFSNWTFHNGYTLFTMVVLFSKWTFHNGYTLFQVGNVTEKMTVAIVVTNHPIYVVREHSTI